MLLVPVLVEVLPIKLGPVAVVLPIVIMGIGEMVVPVAFVLAGIGHRSSHWLLGCCACSYRDEVETGHGDYAKKFTPSRR